MSLGFLAIKKRGEISFTLPTNDKQDKNQAEKVLL